MSRARAIDVSDTAMDKYHPTDPRSPGMQRRSSSCGNLAAAQVGLPKQVLKQRSKTTVLGLVSPTASVKAGDDVEAAPRMMKVSSLELPLAGGFTWDETDRNMEALHQTEAKPHPLTHSSTLLSLLGRSGSGAPSPGVRSARSNASASERSRCGATNWKSGRVKPAEEERAEKAKERDQFARARAEALRLQQEAVRRHVLTPLEQEDRTRCGKGRPPCLRTAPQLRAWTI